MAGINIDIYNKAGTDVVTSYIDGTSETVLVSTILADSSVVSAGITALSETVGGTALSSDTELASSVDTLYDVTPEPTPSPTGNKVIKKIMHGGDEYGVGGVSVGESYTAGDGISISNGEISVDTATAPYDNTTSGATASNVQDAIDEVYSKMSGNTFEGYMNWVNKGTPILHRNTQANVLFNMPTGATRVYFICEGSDGMGFCSEPMWLFNDNAGKVFYFNCGTSNFTIQKSSSAEQMKTSKSGDVYFY